MTAPIAGDFSAWGVAAARKALHIDSRQQGPAPSGQAQSATDILSQIDKDKDGGLSYGEVASTGLANLIDANAKSDVDNNGDGLLSLSQPETRRETLGTPGATENLVKSMMELETEAAKPPEEAAGPYDPTGNSQPSTRDSALSRIADFLDPDNRVVSVGDEDKAAARSDIAANRQTPPPDSATGLLQSEFQTDSSFDRSVFKDQLALQTGVATFQNTKALFSGAAA
ncbi:hypothetical protein [Rhodovulum kholense]|uniref:EF-hand domain-containing protein n=1 Tax=Rhodovulum kholense TaxID=453584 RepID=A0A8E2VKR1_9RHOB|nr:hypothetical protein [Rhodovulum kholense]PTW50167.1 hypothetical protein C8N38_105125 [Rhodovulum kholense]